MLVNLTILSYHKFTEKYDSYPFSRTWDQFTHDLQKKIYDWITIDDGMKSMIFACDILRQHNVRAKLFICTSLIGTYGYCTWDELKFLSKFHDIENHSSKHEYLTKLEPVDQYVEILGAQHLIEKHIGRSPRYFVPPYNTFNDATEQACTGVGLVMLKDRITIKNDSR